MNNKPIKEDTIDALGFVAIKKFIPPRGIKCKDCMNNPIPDIIKKLKEFELWGDNPWVLHEQIDELIKELED